MGWAKGRRRRKFEASPASRGAVPLPQACSVNNPPPPLCASGSALQGPSTGGRRGGATCHAGGRGACGQVRSTGHGSGQALGGSCAHLKSNKGTGVSRGTDLGLRADLRREGAQTLSIVLMWTWTHTFKDCRLGDLVAYTPIIAHSRLARAVRSPRDFQRVPTRALRAPHLPLPSSCTVTLPSS